MAYIEFQNVGVDFPIYNSSSRSLKKGLMQIATGGQIDSRADGKVTVKALENVSFKIASGDRVGLIGHNGAGKTTLLRMLSGVYHPTHGRIEVKGSIGSLIALSLGIDPEFSGRENIFIRGALLGIGKKEIKSKLEEIIEFSELGEFIDMPVRTYSSGMQLRLAFSVSTIFRPDILLMDEWLSVGDESFKHKAEARMNSLIESTKILVIASHSKDLLENTCNKAIWMEHGRVRMFGPSAEVANCYFENFKG